MSGVPNDSAIRSVSWWTLRSEVSMTRSASPRRLASAVRSRRSPSSSRPLAWSGWGRRAASWRRTSTSSVASRNSSVVSPADGVLGEVGLQGVEERPGPDVDHDRDRLAGAAALVDQPDDVAQQRRREVVDDVEAEVLQLLGGGAAAGAGHPGDDDDLAGVLGAAARSTVGRPSVLLEDLAGGGVHGLTASLTARPRSTASLMASGGARADARAPARSRRPRRPAASSASRSA